MKHRNTYSLPDLKSSSKPHMSSPLHRRYLPSANPRIATDRVASTTIPIEIPLPTRYLHRPSAQIRDASITRPSEGPERKLGGSSSALKP
jgi:hypothetical protein